MKEGLTAKQADVYNAILAFSIENGYPPTIRDICSKLNKSVGAIQNSLRILERKDFIEREHGKTRTIKVVYDR
jgi:repressor LexA